MITEFMFRSIQECATEPVTMFLWVDKRNRHGHMYGEARAHVLLYGSSCAAHREQKMYTRDGGAGSVAGDATEDGRDGQMDVRLSKGGGA